MKSQECNSDFLGRVFSVDGNVLRVCASHSDVLFPFWHYTKGMRAQI